MEEGDDATAYALRWCVTNDRWPHYIGDGPRGWAWGNGAPKNVPKPHTKGYQRAVLPSMFFVVRSGATVGHYGARLSGSWRFGSDVEALKRLGEVLQEVRRLVGLAPEYEPGGSLAPTTGAESRRRLTTGSARSGSGRAGARGQSAAAKAPMGKWRKLFEVGLSRPKGEYTLGPPATSAQLKAVEDALGGELPAEVRALLSEFNGVWRPYEDMEDSSDKEIVYLGTDGMLKDVPDYLRNWGEPPNSPSGNDLRKVAFVGQVNGFAELYGVCLQPVGEFEAGEVVKLDHESGELEGAYSDLKEFVRYGPK